MSVYHILYSKTTERNVSDEKIDSQFEAMRVRAFRHFARNDLISRPVKLVKGGGLGHYVFDADFVFEHTGNRDVTLGISDIIAAMNSAGAPYGWVYKQWFKAEGSDEDPVGVNSAPVVAPVTEEPVVEETMEIDLGENRKYFKGLYERDAQISVVLSAVEAARATKFNHRFASVLYGPPGSGKTTITQGLLAMVGEQNAIRFDGPSCTRAGLENFFLNGDNDVTGPKVMIFEEIEKSDPETLKVLLAILDSRGEIRKTTGNNGQQSQDVKVLCVATVNNYSLFEKLHAGALASRFTHKIHCPKPSRKCLESVLLREIESVNGNPDWIQPTLDYVIGVEGCHDPRRAIAICLSGRNKLLDGSYQKALKFIKPTK